MDELLTDLTAHPAATAGDYAAREGFGENLLGVPVPLPSLAGVETVLLPYTHFSVLLRTDKRLAAVTGVGIDGGTLMDLDRAGIPWRLDPRLPADQQAAGAGLRPERHRPRPSGPPGERLSPGWRYGAGTSQKPATAAVPGSVVMGTR